MEALLLLVMGVTNIFCFFVGAKVGQTVTQGEKVELPTVNPMEIYTKKKAEREAKREQDTKDTIRRNIDNYNGTSMGQEDV